MRSIPGAGHTLRDLLGELNGLGDRVGTGLDGALNRGVGIAPAKGSATAQQALRKQLAVRGSSAERRTEPLEQMFPGNDPRAVTHASSHTSKVFWRSLIRPSLTVTSA
jgi:hypothetical protein